MLSPLFSFRQTLVDHREPRRRPDSLRRHRVAPRLSAILKQAGSSVSRAECGRISQSAVRSARGRACRHRRPRCYALLPPLRRQLRCGGGPARKGRPFTRSPGVSALRIRTYGISAANRRACLPSKVYRVGSTAGAVRVRPFYLTPYREVGMRAFKFPLHASGNRAPFGVDCCPSLLCGILCHRPFWSCCR
jgi:hypothetical protein